MDCPYCDDFIWDYGGHWKCDGCGAEFDDERDIHHAQCVVDDERDQYKKYLVELTEDERRIILQGLWVADCELGKCEQRSHVRNVILNRRGGKGKLIEGMSVDEVNKLIALNRETEGNMIQIENGKTFVEFGNADIRITCGRSDFGKPILFLKNEEPACEIGALQVMDTDVEEQNALCDVCLTFDNVKSIEVLILKLQQARATALQTDKDTTHIEDITSVYQANEVIGG